MENKNEKPVVTRAEKTDTAKKLIRSLLEKGALKSNDLIDEGAKLYVEKFESDDTPNSVKGRIGSVIDVMKKDGEIVLEGGKYALTTRLQPLPTQEESNESVVEKPKKTRTSKKKTEESQQETKKEEITETAKTEEKPKKKRVTKKTEAKTEEEKKQPLPPPPMQPIAPVVPITPEIAPEPIPEEKTEEKPKKRGRKAKAEKVEKVEEKVAETIATEEKEQPKIEEEKKENSELIKADVVDMSFLLGAQTPKKELPKREEPKQITQRAESLAQNTEKPTVNGGKTVKTVKTPRKVERMTVKKPTRALTADEKLQEAFLKRLRKLGGDYFEYYSVYLLEKYSRLNGRRLEMLKITGGERDGGIDGEIELTDKLGFRETIYIQAKNWDPDKGDERLWVVGETLLQQFIGACVCRQAKDGKQHCRGIFITTSRFTAEAKKILEDTSDKFVGYDGNDLYETAKECGYGIVKKNGEWVLDEELLSGEKAFFRTC